MIKIKEFCIIPEVKEWLINIYFLLKHENIFMALSKYSTNNSSTVNILIFTNIVPFKHFFKTFQEGLRFDISVKFITK